MNITPDQREILIAMLRQFIPGVAVWAYGSRVKGTARPYSDLDLVVFATPEQRHLVLELKEALDESNIPFLVDLLIWDELPDEFHQSIDVLHVVLQDGECDRDVHSLLCRPQLGLRLSSARSKLANNCPANIANTDKHLAER
ncbi:MAG: nucleotidyltransferase domain-containing protein [Magnetococcus sp. DMHC-8]